MYAVGIDIGTTYTAAAIWRDGRAEIAVLGSHAAAIPSAVFPRPDGSFLTGEAAGRRGLTEPDRVVRDLKRRLGDTSPILVGGAPYSAAALTARMLRSVLEAVTAREGGPPAAISITHPASWGPYKIDVMHQVVRLADIEQPVRFTTEAEAAATFHARQRRLEPGAVVAVYDLGGGIFDAAVLRLTSDGFAVIGEPEGIERCGGNDLDDAVLAHVAAAGGALEALDRKDPAVIAARARLLAECTQAREALSTDSDAVVPVLLPGVSTEVRLTRSDLEGIVRPLLRDSVEALRTTIRSAGYAPQALGSVLLVGGSSRMPIVAEMIGSELGRPVAVDANPKHAVALGAAWHASGALAAPAPASPAPAAPTPAPSASAAPTPSSSAPTAPAPATPPPTPPALIAPPAAAPAPTAPAPPTPAPPTPAPIAPAPIAPAAAAPAAAAPAAAAPTPTAPIPAPPMPAPSTPAEPATPTPGSDWPTGEIPRITEPVVQAPTPIDRTGGIPAQPAAGTLPRRPLAPEAGFVGRVAAGSPAGAAPFAAPFAAPPVPPAGAAPFAPPPAQPAKATGRVVAFAAAALGVLLLAVAGTVWVLGRAQSGDTSTVRAAADQQGLGSAAPASSAAGADGAAPVPADEQCTDEMKKSTRWVCLTKATLHDGTFTVWYDAEWNGTPPDIKKGFHLHLYGGDGTRPDESTMGSQAVKHSKYYFEDQQPSVRKTSDPDFEAVGDAEKVCARIAHSGHGLEKAYDGSYHTGNCVPIQRY